MVKRNGEWITWYGGFALAVLVAGYLWAAIHVYGSNQANDAADAAYHQHQSWEEVVRSCDELAGDGLLSCVIERGKAKAEDPYAKYDLQAQQDMARWALLVLVISVVGVGVSGVGVWLLLRTLRDQRKQFAAERRPWVSVQDLELTGPLSFKGGKWNVPVRIELANHGASPATYVSAHTEMSALLDFERIPQLQALIRDRIRSDRGAMATSIFPDTRGVTMRAEAAVSDDDLATPVAVEQEAAPSDEWPYVFLSFIAYGVVRYESPIGGPAYTTGFAWHLQIDGSASFLFDPESKQDIEVAQDRIFPGALIIGSELD